MAIQEPYLDCNHNTCANPHWYTLYPKEHYVEPEKTTSIIFINKWITTDSWIQVDFSSSDVTAVQVQTAVGVVLIINTYNQIVHTNTINWILQVMRTRVQGRSDMPNATHTLWLGDFNRHHPLWDESHNTHLFTRVQELIDAITELGLHMILPKDLLMLHALASGNFPRPDNVFALETLATSIVKCTMIPEEQPTRTNHLPIFIHLTWN